MFKIHTVECVTIAFQKCVPNIVPVSLRIQRSTVNSLQSALVTFSRDSFVSVAAVWPPVSVRTELFLTFE